MKFQFDIHLTDNDYLNYNKFWMLRSPYGKKQMIMLRVVVAIVFVSCILFTLLTAGFSLVSLITAILLALCMLLFEALLSPYFVLILKLHLKSLKKKGKMGYSPYSVIAFYEDVFVETTEHNKTELKYTAIERISVVDNRMIYIHVNNIMAYLLPVSCFASKEQQEEFFAFIKTKCANIESY